MADGASRVLLGDLRCCNTSINAHTHARTHARFTPRAHLTPTSLSNTHSEVSCDFIGVRPIGEVPSAPGGASGSSSLPTLTPAPAPAAPAPAVLEPSPEQQEQTADLKQPAQKEEEQQQQQPEKQPEQKEEQPPAQQQQQQPAAALLAAVDLLPPADAGLSVSGLAAGALNGKKLLPLNAQCGGRGGACVGALCRDAPFEGYACAAGSACVRQSGFFHMCVADADAGRLGPGWRTAAPPAGAACALPLEQGQQCGGRGGSCAQSGGGCADAPYRGSCCAASSCRRRDEWYWECEA